MGYLISVFGFVGYLMIRKPIDLFIVQIIFGVCEAISAPAFDGLYSRHLDKGKFASEWGLWESMNWIVAAIAAALGGLFASVFGFRFLFVVMLLLSLAGLIISGLLLSRKRLVKKRASV